MATETVTFDGWEKGEFGDIGSREAAKDSSGQTRVFGVLGHRWLPTQFSGKNMIRYRDGLLGPRAGVRNVGLTGLGNGKIKAIGGGNVGTVVVIGSSVFSFDPASYGSAAVAWTMTDSITDAFVKPGEMPGTFAREYVLVYGGFAYRLENATTTCSKLTGATVMPSGRCAAAYQDRIIIGGSSAQPQRLFYSDPGSAGWETFQPTSYYDLPGLAITTIMPFRSGLLVGTVAGTFVYITGTLGSTAVIRTLSNQGAPADTAKGALLATDEVVFMALDRPYSAIYNGAIHKADNKLRFAGNNYQSDSSETPTFRALKLIGPDDWLMLCGLAAPAEALNRAIMCYEGVHTYHTWGQNIGAWGQVSAPGKVLLAKDGTGGTPPVFYNWTTELQRPGFTTDTDARPGDDSTTPLDAFAHLNQFFDAQGDELVVLGVQVDFKKWNTGAAATNHFDLTVRALSRFSNGPLGSSTVSFDEAGASSSTTGDDFRVQFPVGDQGSGSGFEIWFDAVRGVAIRSVTVTFERQPSRTR